jgi:hypothetical protein
LYLPRLLLITFFDLLAPSRVELTLFRGHLIFCF